jgi:hypothetical protein
VPDTTQQSPGSTWKEGSKPYFALPYMNPFKFWLPMPLIRINGDSLSDIGFDGAGLLSVMMDPTDRNYVRLIAYGDIRYRMALIQDFTWINTTLGFPLTFGFSDQVIRSGDDVYRDTRGSLSGTFTWGLGGGNWQYGLSAGGMYYLSADDDGGASAYQWNNSGSDFIAFAGAALSNHTRYRHETFGNGLRFNARGISFVDSFEPRYDGLLEASLERPLPLSLNLYGAYDQRKMDLQGVSRTYGAPLFSAFASKEYPSPGGQKLSWLLGGEAALGLFSFNVQKNLSHIYTNRIFGTLALRNAVYDSKGTTAAEGIRLTGDILLAQSAVLKLNMVFAIIPLKNAPLFIEPNLWGAWKFSNTITGRGSPWYVDFGVTLRF